MLPLAAGPLHMLFPLPSSLSLINSYFPLDLSLDLPLLQEACSHSLARPSSSFELPVVSGGPPGSSSFSPVLSPPGSSFVTLTVCSSRTGLGLALH